jgi:hypothetical protein
VASSGWGSPVNSPDATVADERRLAVHDLGCPHHRAAEHLPEALVAEAHAEHRLAAGEVADGLVGEAGVVGRARSRGDQHAVGVELDGIVGA